MDVNPAQETTSGTEVTDKLPIEEVFDLHPRRPRPIRLNARSVGVVLGGLAFAVTAVVILGLKIGSPERLDSGDGSYDSASGRPADAALDRLHPVPDWAETYAFLQPPSPDDVVDETEKVGTDLASAEPKRPVDLREGVADLRKQALLDELLTQMRDGFDSPVLFTVRDRRHSGSRGTASPVAAESLTPSGALPRIAARTSDLMFLRNPGRQPNRVSGMLRAPESPYELRAGSVIPAALITAIHSDLPGDLVAQVVQHVYDAETGEHLLVPQGSRLIGTYRNEIASGQKRVLVVWQRLILPNGKSIGLDAMPGVDPTGAAGLHDQVDYHLKQLVGATALSSAIALTGNFARGVGDRDEPISIVGETVAQQSARFGQQVIDRQLNRPPTITIRAGYRFNVLVNRDIPLEPYQRVSESP